ncbi:uncharacterized protein C10orf62 homolog [Pipistrellus kuhlii]|uniref:Uncharacterized protein n=1 Tax=Pipistrellus kuhlii TaxID=59472 RepID=A0A7J7VAU5_PIPKU|nr:uncharacterized protein C10orf62 homolog [Pipistrellus kuhlii]XP_045437920.1 uncharacterized protein C10orf62 homolog [Pipistrellus kuhlii]KAF6322086.1 hypothetical protein mPipKuh1_001623 [Pipistrellus kuhlii]
MMWLRRRRRRRKLSAVPPPEEHEPQERPKEQNENWIKSHFSRLSEEKLAPGSSVPAPQPDTVNREANPASREPFPNKQKAPGYSGVRETHKESSTDEATWAAVAATTKELDNKGRQLANSMLQRAMVYRNSGHLEAKDINQEDLKALQEMEIKLKGNFLTQRETTVAGMNHTHTFHGHGHHGHQDHPSHPNHHQSHSLPTRSHQTYHPFEAT